MPNVQEQAKSTERTDIFNYLGSKPYVFGLDLPFTMNTMEKGWEKLKKHESEQPVDELFYTPEYVNDKLQSLQVVDFSQQYHFTTTTISISFLFSFFRSCCLSQLSKLAIH